jgi:deazaflavin-dependent oxidoreductase (nitroreductase family)
MFFRGWGRADGRIVDASGSGLLKVIQQPGMSAAQEEITMAYLKPPAFTRRLANPLAMRLNARGVAALTLVSRRTGETRKVPVIPVEVGGSRHLVSPYGGSDWVRNLRAAGKGELSRKGRTEAFHAVEVPVDQRGPVIARVSRIRRSRRRPGVREAA